jgi:P27 family predicted phage terminase small subunit
MRLTPPKDLSPAAKAEWQRIVTILAETKPLTQADIAALVIYSTSYATYAEAQAKVEEQGSVVVGTTGSPIKNPYLAVMKESWDRLKVLLPEFGLTPASRAKMAKQEPPPAPKADDFSDL